MSPWNSSLEVIFLPLASITSAVPRNRREEVPRERDQTRASCHARLRGHVRARVGASPLQERRKGPRAGHLPHASGAEVLRVDTLAVACTCGDLRRKQHCR